VAKSDAYLMWLDRQKIASLVAGGEAVFKDQLNDQTSKGLGKSRARHEPGKIDALNGKGMPILRRVLESEHVR